jgi:hypothetical protein
LKATASAAMTRTVTSTKPLRNSTAAIPELPGRRECDPPRG